MRVVSGKAKGRNLESVRGTGTRPVTDWAKSALFDIIAPYVAGSRFLDLFAGTGQVGIEALSRWAKEAVFVEREPEAIETIEANLDHTELKANARVVQADVFQFLKRSPQPFDFIYVAPPQYHGLWSDTLRLLDSHMGWLAEDGWIIVQIDPTEFEELDLESVIRFDQRTYGGVMLCFYARPVEE